MTHAQRMRSTRRELLIRRTARKPLQTSDAAESIPFGEPKLCSANRLPRLLQGNQSTSRFERGETGCGSRAWVKMLTEWPPALSTRTTSSRKNACAESSGDAGNVLVAMQIFIVTRDGRHDALGARLFTPTTR